MRRSWSPGAGAPSLPAAFAIAAGIAAAVTFAVPPSAALGAALVLASVAGIAAGRGRGRAATLGGLALAAAAGFWSARARWLLPAGRTEAAARAAIAEALARDPDAGGALVEVVGRVGAPWSPSGSQRRTRLDVESASGDAGPLALDAPVALVVAGETDPSPIAEVGDLVRVKGTLRLPERGGPRRAPVDLPDQPHLLLKSGAQIERISGPAGPFGPVQRARAALKRRLRANLAGAPEADRTALALLLAFVLGDTQDVPLAAVGAFRDGGVAHIVAISGLQVALVAALLGFLVRRAGASLPGRDAIVLAATLLFAVFAGGRPPVWRAALMIGLYLAARLLGRPTSPEHVLGFSASAILLADPSALFDVGFLLTFAAVFGLAEFGAPVVAALRRRGVPAPLADAVGATLGAELAVLPDPGFRLQRRPVRRPALESVHRAPLRRLSARGSRAPASSPRVPRRRGRSRSSRCASSRISSSGSSTRSTGCTPSGSSRRRPSRSRRPRRALLLVAGLAAIARPQASGARVRPPRGRGDRRARPPAAAAEGTAVLRALDVGQGDCWLLVTPRGRVLVDGGGSPDRAYEFGRLRLIPKLADLGAVALDAVVLTHPHPDHARGLLAVLSSLPVGRVVLPRAAPRNAFLDEVLAVAAKKAPRPRAPRRGRAIRGRGTRVRRSRIRPTRPIPARRRTTGRSSSGPASRGGRFS